MSVDKSFIAGIFVISVTLIAAYQAAFMHFPLLSQLHPVAGGVFTVIMVLFGIGLIFGGAKNP